MGRNVRDARLDTREARLRLKVKHEPYWRLIHQGLHLGYRKGKLKCTWIARMRNEQTGGYDKHVLGSADDIHDSDGVEILNFREATEKAMTVAKSQSKLLTKNITVSQAVDHYLDWAKDNIKTYHETKNKIESNILPHFGNKIVAKLSTLEIKKWHQALAAKPPKRRTSKLRNKTIDSAQTEMTDDQKRARKVTANRLLVTFKAILNKAFQDELVNDDNAWRRVKPFSNVDQPNKRFLSVPECTRLINACDPDIRQLVRGALLTGARYSELANLQVKDVMIDQKLVYIKPSKSGKPRYVSLSPEGVEFFKTAVIGKLGDELVFTKSNGSAWNKNLQQRPLKEACERAKIQPPVRFHELRHTYASHLAQNGTSEQTIADLQGHADTRITTKHYAHLSNEVLAKAVNENLPSYFNENNNIIEIGNI